MKAAYSDREPEPVKLPGSAGAALAIELRHLRYFVALADAGSFTWAAERMFVAQPTLSQQIRRLEEIIGTPLLQRRRDGLRLSKACAVPPDASRAVLSLVDQEVNRTRQAAGLGRQRLRVVVPPGLPDALAVEAASMLKSAAAAAGVEIVWIETPLDAEISLIRQRRADVGLGWLTVSPEALPAPLDMMGLADFEPDVWIPSAHAAPSRETIKLADLGREVPARREGPPDHRGAAPYRGDLGQFLVVGLVQHPLLGRSSHSDRCYARCKGMNWPLSWPGWPDLNRRPLRPEAKYPFARLKSIAALVILAGLWARSGAFCRCSQLPRWPARAGHRHQGRAGPRDHQHGPAVQQRGGRRDRHGDQRRRVGADQQPRRRRLH